MTWRQGQAPSPWWWAVRVPAVGFFLAAWWESSHGDYRAAYNLLLSIFVTYAIFGTPPPVWPRPSVKGES